MSEPTVPKQSLVSKLAEACNAVGGVDKKGRNEIQKYGYQKASDIAKAFRHELFSRGIIAIVDEKDWSQLYDIPTNSGRPIPLMQLRADVIFMDESQKLPFQAFSTAMDSGDKAIYKAKTGLWKYVLKQLGLIPDEADDPEADESVDAQTRDFSEEAPSRKSRKAKERVADFQVRAFDSMCHQTGKTAEQVAEYLRSKFDLASVADLARIDFNDAIKWAAQSTDLKQQIEESLVAAGSRKKVNGQEPEAPKETTYEAV